MKFYLFILSLIPLLFLNCEEEKEKEECPFFFYSCRSYAGCVKFKCCEGWQEGTGLPLDCERTPYDCRNKNICSLEYLNPDYPAVSGNIYCLQGNGRCRIEWIFCSTHQECIERGYKLCHFETETCTDLCHYEYSECNPEQGCQKAIRVCPSKEEPYEEIKEVELNCNEHNFCISPYTSQNLRCNPEDGLCYPKW